MRITKIPFSAGGADRQKFKRDAMETLAAMGSGLPPSPPRDLQIQSGARKVVVNWTAPINEHGVVGFRVKSPDETTIFEEIRDRTRRRSEVVCNAGADPVTVNIFVVSINAQGVESAPIYGQGKALAEAAAPLDPANPPGWSSGGDVGGGGSRSGSGGRGFLGA